MADTQAPVEEVENTGDLRGQAALFDGARDGLVRRLESPVLDADEAAIERAFGRGRPKGAKNIATTKRLELFARVCGDPMLASARILAMPTAELAGMLGCTALEAERFRQAERALILPYVISKRPQDVNLNTALPPALHLHFPVPADSAPRLAGGAVALLQMHAQQLGQEILPPEELPEETEA